MKVNSIGNQTNYKINDKLVTDKLLDKQDGFV